MVLHELNCSFFLWIPWSTLMEWDDIIYSLSSWPQYTNTKWKTLFPHIRALNFSSLPCQSHPLWVFKSENKGREVTLIKMVTVFWTKISFFIKKLGNMLSWSHLPVMGLMTSNITYFNMGTFTTKRVFIVNEDYFWTKLYFELNGWKPVMTCKY